MARRFPGHAVTYGVMPLHMRMPWIASLSFGYLSVLSFTRGGDDGIRDSPLVCKAV